MKKFLLFAVAALVAGSVSAQTTFKKGSSAKKSSPQTAVKMKNLQQGKMPASYLQQAPTKATAKIRPELMNKQSLDEMKDLKFNAVRPVNSIKTARRAGSFCRAYNASGLNKNGQATNWVMTPSAIDGGGDCLINIIPSPFSNVEEIPVTYTIEGGTITIPAQKVGEASATYQGEQISLYCYLCNISSSSVDGSQQLTLSEDGTLTADNYYYAYVFFMVDGVDWTQVWTYQYYTNVKYVDIDKPQPPVVMYEPEGIYLHAGFSPTFYHYSSATIAVVPAQEVISFRNMTTDLADDWTWDVTDADDQPVLSTSNKDLEFMTSAGSEYYAPILNGFNQGLQSEVPYQWGAVSENTVSYVEAGMTQSAFRFGDGSYATMSRANPDFSIAYYGYLGTPDVNTQGYSVEKLILYQGIPAAPLYFTGVNMLVRNPVVNENSVLKCQIVRASRDNSGSLELGDVIAEADLDLESTVIDDNYGIGSLAWTSFYKEDELGMTETIDHLFITEEFAIIIDGWDNGTFSAIPYGEYDGNENSTMNTFGKDTGDDRIYRYSDARMYVGFIDAAYGYMMTNDNTNITLPADGGEAKINVGPMLYYYNDNGEAVTGIWLDEDAGSDEIPDWLQIKYTNPVQVDVDDEGDPIYDISFDLIFEAEALPAGTTSRSCHLIFFQPGAQLEVNVSQEGTSGVSTVVKKTVTDGPAYNLNGQRVNANYKGIVVKDGAKAIKK